MKLKIPEDDKSRAILGIQISNNLSSKYEKTFILLWGLSAKVYRRAVQDLLGQASFIRIANNPNIEIVRFILILAARLG
jgi:hypothetical protein